MASDVVLPKLDFSMAEGTISQWLAEDGATVQAGAPLYELETGKALQEIEAPASGRLRIIAQAGETHPIGTRLAILE